MLPKWLFWADHLQPSWNGWETGCKPISWSTLTAYLGIQKKSTPTAKMYFFIPYKVSHKMELLLHEIEHLDAPNEIPEFSFMSVHSRLHLRKCNFEISKAIVSQNFIIPMIIKETFWSDNYKHVFRNLCDEIN